MLKRIDDLLVPVISTLLLLVAAVLVVVDQAKWPTSMVFVGSALVLAVLGRNQQ